MFITLDSGVILQYKNALSVEKSLTYHKKSQKKLLQHKHIPKMAGYLHIQITTKAHNTDLRMHKGTKSSFKAINK